MNTRLTDEIAERMKESTIIITDTNGTVSRDRPYNPFKCFLPTLVEDVRQCDLKKSRIYLLTSSLEMLSSLNHLHVLDNFGLKTFYRTLGDIDERVYETIENFIETHLAPNVKECFKTIKNFGEAKKLIVSTRNFDFIARSAQKILGANDYVSNAIVNKNGVARLLIEKPEDRRELIKEKLKEHDARLQDCIVFGNEYRSDLVPFRPPQYSKVFIASPSSKKTVREGADLFLSNYGHLEQQVRQQL